MLEAEITGGLEHPGIVPVYALGENSDGRLFYAMRLVRGETLKERIRKFHQAGSINRQHLAFRQLLNHFVRICDIVAYAHSRGVLHRDLKPSNVMLGKFGETLVVDWGLAKTINPSPESQPAVPAEVKLRPISGSSVKGTLHGATLGTPQYMSPEQALGQLERVSIASDVYGLGATLYCILTGSPPLGEINDLGAVLSRVALGDIPPPRSLKTDIPPTLEAVCKKAMAVRPEDRYATVRNLEADIESWLADEPVQGVAEPLGRRLAAFERKHRTFFRISAMALVVVALVAVLAALFVNAARERAEARRREAIEYSRMAEARKKEANDQRDAMRHLTTRLTLDRGLNLLETGSSRAGVLWLARSLESANGQHDPLEPAIRANLGAWMPLIHRERDCLEHDAPVRIVAWSPTGRAIATGSDDGIVRLWDPTSSSTASSSKSLKLEGAVQAIAFSHDGKTLAAACEGQTAWLANTASGLTRGQAMRHLGPIVSLAFSPDDKLLLTASFDGTIRFWDAATGQPRGQPITHTKPIQSALMSPDGKAIAGLDESGDVFIWRLGGSDSSVQRHQGPSDVEVIAYSPDSSKLACGGRNGQIVLANAADGSELGRASKDVPDERIQAIAFSHDGSRIAAGGYDTSCSVWRVPDLVRLSPRMDHRGHVWAVAFSPDDSLLAAAVDDNTAQLWNTLSFQHAGDPLPHQKPVRAVAFSPDNRMLVTGCEDGVARVWQLGSDSGLGQPMHHDETVRAIVGRPDGKAIAVVTAAGRVCLWDAATTRPIAGRRPRAVRPLRSGVQPLGYRAGHGVGRWHHPALGRLDPGVHWLRDQDGRKDQVDRDQPGWKLARGRRPDRPARLLGRADRRALAPIASLPESVISLAYNPDGTRLAVGSASGEVRLWDAARFRPIGEPMRHQSAVRHVAFSPDGSRLASASYDKTARLWNVGTGAHHRLCNDP